VLAGHRAATQAGIWGSNTPTMRRWPPLSSVMQNSPPAVGYAIYRSSEAPWTSSVRVAPGGDQAIDKLIRRRHSPRNRPPAASRRTLLSQKRTPARLSNWQAGQRISSSVLTRESSSNDRRVLEHRSSSSSRRQQHRQPVHPPTIATPSGHRAVVGAMILLSPREAGEFDEAAIGVAERSLRSACGGGRDGLVTGMLESCDWRRVARGHPARRPSISERTPDDQP
jgi:hypothetical protein